MKKKKGCKRIVAALMILAATIAIELLFNYHAIIEGYSPLDISDHITFTHMDGSAGYLISYESQSGIYVRQIKLVGDYSDTCKYKVNAVLINGFNKKKERTYDDTTTSWFSDYYTNIDARINSFEIFVPQYEGTDQIKAAFLLNQFEINKYRVLFVLCLLCLLYLGIFEHVFIHRIEYFFLSFAALFGLLIILYGQCDHVSWDDEVHFERVYSAAYGKDVKWTAAARAVIGRALPTCNTKAEYAQLRPVINEMGQQVLYTEKKETGIIPYSYASYVPMIAFLKIGIWLHLPFTWLFMFGKAGNLISFIVLVFLAIRLAKGQKLLLAFVSMMPTTITLAATYNYDGFVIACLELGCVLWWNEIVYSRKSIHKMAVIAMPLLLTVGCFSKAVYAPLALLVLAIPGIYKSKTKRKYIYAGVLVLVALTMMTFVLPFLTNVVSKNVAYGGDSRGGDTSAVRQAISMVKHPITSFRLMLASILQWDGFKVQSLSNPAPTFTYYFIGCYMLLCFGQLGSLPASWDAILFPVFLLLFLHNEKTQEDNRKICVSKRIYGSIILVATIALIWLSMYLGFSEVGENVIIGVQPRYFIPLIYLGAILFQNDKIVLKASPDFIAKIMTTSVNAIWMYAVYGIWLCDRLL